MAWVRLPVYFYIRNDTFYFSWSIPSDLQHRFKKCKIEAPLRTKSESKGAKSAAALSDRLERYQDSLRIEIINSREPGLEAIQCTKRSFGNHCSFSDALDLYHRLKSKGENKLFYNASNRSISFMQECLRHENLSDLEIYDASWLRDYLFAQGMLSSSAKLMLSSVTSIVNSAIRERGLAVTNVFSGTVIPDEGTKQRRNPIPSDVFLRVQLDC